MHSYKGNPQNVTCLGGIWGLQWSIITLYISLVWIQWKSELQGNTFVFCYILFRYIPSTFYQYILSCVLPLNLSDPYSHNGDHGNRHLNRSVDLSELQPLKVSQAPCGDYHPIHLSGFNCTCLQCLIVWPMKAALLVPFLPVKQAAS